MSKRITALLLTALVLVGCLAGCYDRKIDGENVFGAEITLYLTDPVYELDPALCLNNDSAYQLCSLLYDTLFKIDANGKLVPSIAESYEIIKNEKKHEYKMNITLRSGNSWSDGIYVSAEDCIYAWKRVLDPEFNSEACCLLYDILNAREAKQGDCSIDDVGIYAIDELVLQITFVGDIDYNAFLLNLTSIALAPLRERIVEKNGDWAKKPATTVNSGPFMIRRVNYGFDTANTPDPSYASLTLERNSFYRRGKDSKHLDESVTPYRLIVDFSRTKEEQLADFAEGKIFYVGDIALSARANYKDTAVINDLLSTHTYYLNEKADIVKADGTTEKLFADKNIRLALSAAIDREAIASQIVFAKAASAIVPGKVFEAGSAKTLFRSVGGDLIKTTADTSAAAGFISASGKNPADYTFSISVRADDEVHVAVAEAVCESWKQLGFNVSVNKVQLSVNDEKLAGEDVKDIYDDNFCERFYDGRFEVAAIDLIANTPDAFSVLAPFATGYSGQGQAMTSDEYIDVPHKTGYSDEAYDAIIDKAVGAANSADRAAALHEAEARLMEDMPVIPILFNQDAYLISGDLSKVKVDYFGGKIFTKAKLKNYLDYIVITTEEEEEKKEAE